ncbi:MAG: RecQ family ATP-dependent DNA helicase, partial [Caldilineaceae bacterium]
MRVLIVAKTRMRGGACIGAISTTGQSLRLVPADLDPDGSFNLEYNVGEVWELDDFQFATDLVPPHVENVLVHRKHIEYRHDNPERLIEGLMPPACGGVGLLYDGLVQTSVSGSMFISEGTGVPGFSTMFWRPDNPLTLDDSGKRLHYSYPTPNGPAKLAYVGFQDVVEEIPAGTLVRVSLAHWWRPDESDEMELRCYLQLSGWYVSVSPPPPSPPPPPSRPCRDRGVDIHEILRSTFGFDKFRPPQEEIIYALLAGDDVLTIMPTGGGKSLCYQLAAVSFQGVTVVVSPLIALMQDQVDALTTRDIPATFLNSTLDHTTYVERQRMVRENRVRLLYVAPETLARPETINLLQQSKMCLLAIDEAHCISEWGHDFRPDYRQLGHIRRRLPAAPCIALTATATPRVQHDIAECLDIDSAHIYSGDLDRPNLYLEVRRRLGDGVDQVAEFVRGHENQSGIVYCSTRAGVDDLCIELNKLGIAALPYHAGLDDDVRLQNQKRFVNDDVDVMVATIAFGMGIDKSNIRFVVHANMPDCLDEYYQQIGRSGRDGLRADCLLLHSPRDLHTIRYHISNMPPEERPGAYHRLEQIRKWTVSAACRRAHLLNYFGQKRASANCGMCDHCVSIAPYRTDAVDLSEYARLFLTCVLQTRERFGRAHIIDVLRGSQSQKVLERKHDQIPAYGTGRALSAQVWRALADQFIDRGLVKVGNWNVLSIAAPGRKLLDGDTFLGISPSEWGRSRMAKSSIDGRTVQYDMDLFEKLRSLRKSIAGEAGLPPYTIFQDSSLMEMAARYPA